MTIYLSNDGFLSPELEAVVQQIRATHGQIFDFVARLNELAHRSLFSAKVNRDDRRQVLLLTLTQKSMTEYQSVIILSERGLPGEARALLRVLLEVTFRIVAMAKKAELAEAYVAEDQVRRRKLINKFKMLSESLQTNGNREELERVLAEVSERIQEDEIRENTTQSYAKHAGLEDFYNSAYSILSDAVHVNVRELEEALTLDEAGKLIGFTYGPSDSDLTVNLLTAAEALILCLRAAYSVVDVGTAEEIHSIHYEFNELHARYP